METSCPAGPRPCGSSPAGNAPTPARSYPCSKPARDIATACGPPTCPKHGEAGRRADPAYIDAAHRVHARVEDRIRTGKDTGIGRFPSESFAINQAWLAAALIAATLLSWLQQLALDSDLTRAEPKTLRYRVLHTAARLATSGRRRRLRIAATWPWAEAITTAWTRVTALPQAP